jgi:hypothetical protein
VEYEKEFQMGDPALPRGYFAMDYGNPEGISIE